MLIQVFFFFLLPKAACKFKDAGSGIALKTLKRVQKAWGQESISSLQPQQNDFLDYYDGSG
ncbi:hypothetical protein JHK86_010216 [Glycine max]|nr:hypothetical protein JHK86_010216 [Glycine max]